MNDAPATILVLRQRIPPEELRRLVVDGFGDMVKFVVDVEREVIAIGGELHADAEQVLLEDGSRPQDLWGANYYPDQSSSDCVEFTSLINIRPARGNAGMEIGDPGVQERVRALTFTLIGRGEGV